MTSKVIAVVSARTADRAYYTISVPIYRLVLSVGLPLIIFGGLYYYSQLLIQCVMMWVSMTGLMLCLWVPYHVFRCTSCEGRMKTGFFGAHLTCTKCGTEVSLIDQQGRKIS